MDGFQCFGRINFPEKYSIIRTPLKISESLYLLFYGCHFIKKCPSKSQSIFSEFKTYLLKITSLSVEGLEFMGLTTNPIEIKEGGDMSSFFHKKRREIHLFARKIPYFGGRAKDTKCHYFMHLRSVLGNKYYGLWEREHFRAYDIVKYWKRTLKISREMEEGIIRKIYQFVNL